MEPNIDIIIDTLEQKSTTLVTWQEKYVTNINVIDKQHKELFELTNQLHHACQTGNEAAEDFFKKALSYMVQYVRVHFSTEQDLMKRVRYPGYAEHKFQHDSLIREIFQAAHDFTKGRRRVPNNFVRTLEDWICNHVAYSDAVYVSFIMEQKNKGILCGQKLTTFARGQFMTPFPDTNYCQAQVNISGNAGA